MCFTQFNNFRNEMQKKEDGSLITDASRSTIMKCYTCNIAGKENDDTAPLWAYIVINYMNLTSLI